MIKFLYSLKSPIKTMLENAELCAAIAYLPWVPQWITKLVVQWAQNKLQKPMIDLVFRKAGYVIEVNNGNILLKKIQNAEDFNTWNDLTNHV
jgi:hypothetical protein